MINHEKFMFMLDMAEEHIEYFDKKLREKNFDDEKYLKIFISYITTLNAIILNRFDFPREIEKKFLAEFAVKISKVAKKLKEVESLNNGE